MSNQIPEGWQRLQLNNFVTKFQNGYAFSAKGYVPEGIPIISMGSIRLDGLFKKNNSKLKYWSKSARIELDRYLVKDGDLIMAMTDVTPTMELIGRACIVKSSHEYFLNQRVGLISVDGEKVSKDYLSYCTNYNDWRSYCIGSSGLGAQANLGTAQILGGYLTLPPLQEQQKIAAILTSVDDVIEKTQAQINKLKDLKRGMMQELLTRGVGVDGKPHTEFKDSPVGRIPKGWDVKSLGDLSSFITSGSRGWAQYYSESGAIFIRIGNLTREHINFRFKDIIRVSPPESAEGKRTLVQAGDVLISITADLGVIAVVNESIEKAYVNQHVALVRLKDIAISRWVGHYLAFEQTQKQFSANNDSGAKAGLNLTAIRNTVVTLPSESEILSIVKSLDSIDDLIFKKRNKLVTLNSTKKALMQDLLTGKVRVEVE
ncbi:restriction endonuclease subunit S [Photobacterium piscicola]|uniref:restriction endonuclease subunit S n=1 Tax=Photobacterium piscicola TaxID=1378299 RepID=UPI002E17808C|nr:restriction endonuclease subunit S [Photobacterium piscicola]